MRRRLALLTTTIIGLLLVAGPALAAGEEGEAATEKAAEFGLWDGLIYAAIGAVVFGLFVFFDSYAGAEDTGDHGHH